MAGLGELVAFYVGVLTYVGSTAAFFAQLTRRVPFGSPKLAPRLLSLATIFHGLYLTLASVVAKVCPVESVHFALSVAALVACLAYLVGRLRYSIDVLGAFVAPLGLTFLLGTRMVGLGDVGSRLPPTFLALHVGANLIGEGLFFLASVSAGLYLFAEKRLKQKRSSSIIGRLPPLDALDTAEHRFLLVGFPLLTIGIVTGTAWAHQLEGGHPGQVLRAALGYVTWLVFAAVLLLRAALGWRGRRAALGTIAGFFFALLVLLVYLVRPAMTPTISESPHSDLHIASALDVRS